MFVTIGTTSLKIHYVLHAGSSTCTRLPDATYAGSLMLYVPGSLIIQARYTPHLVVYLLLSTQPLHSQVHLGASQQCDTHVPGTTV